MFLSSRQKIICFDLRCKRLVLRNGCRLLTLRAKKAVFYTVQTNAVLELLQIRKLSKLK